MTVSELVITTKRLFEVLRRNTTLQFGPIELVYFEDGQDVSYYGPSSELTKPGLWVILPAFSFAAADGIQTLRTGELVYLADCAGARAAFDSLVRAYAAADVVPIVERPRVGAHVIVGDPPGSAQAELAGKRGSILSIDPLPEHEGGDFWQVQIVDGPIVDWHRDCFVLEPTWRIAPASKVTAHGA